MDMEQQNTIGQDLAFDLRQIYANLTGKHLIDIYEARKLNDYPLYFKCLRNLHVIIKHKFKKPDDDEKKYEGLVRQAVDIFNNYSSDYLKYTKNPEGITKIEYALNQIEMFLFDIMEEANMFGSNRKIQGL